MWVNSMDVYPLFSEENPWDHLFLFSFISHLNQSAVSISCASQIYTKSDHFSSPSLLSLNPSHQHLLCLWFSCTLYNILVVIFLKCKCKHVLPLFQILQCPSITMRIISNIPKWSTSMAWLGTSLPLGPQFLSISAWFTKPKPLWSFFLLLKHAKRFPSSEPLSWLCLLFGTLFVPYSVCIPASSLSFKSHFRYQVPTVVDLTVFIILLCYIMFVALIGTAISAQILVCPNWSCLIWKNKRIYHRVLFDLLDCLYFDHQSYQVLFFTYLVI